MSTTLTKDEAVEIIRLHLASEHPLVGNHYLRGMAEELYTDFTDQITVYPTIGHPQREANLIRINARFNVRADGTITRAYLQRQIAHIPGIIAAIS